MKSDFSEKQIDIIRELIRQASLIANEIVSLPSGEQHIAIKNDQSLVSLADKKIEGFLREKLEQNFPGIKVVGEEQGGEIIPPCWVIDPIDGTTSFIAGLPLWTISLGFINEKKIPSLGFLAIPSLAKIIWQNTSGRLFENQREIKTISDNGNNHQAQDNFSSQSQIAVHSTFHRRLRIAKDFPGKVRSLGSTALHGSFVATGYLTASIIGRPRLWDIAAGWSHLLAQNLNIYRALDKKNYAHSQWEPLTLDYFLKNRVPGGVRPSVLIAGTEKLTRELVKFIHWDGEYN